MEPKYEVYNDVFDDTADGVNLLISILVRYPEVSTINFNPEKKTIKFSFLLNSSFKIDDLMELKDLLMDTIEVYNMLNARDTRVRIINDHTLQKFLMLNIERDIDTLEQKEIELIIQCLKQSINEMIIKDDSNIVDYEDLKFQDELIETMLESIKSWIGSKPLFGFREEGRVIVFDK